MAEGMSITYTRYLAITWHKQYIELQKKKEAEEKEARMSKLRPSIRNSLKGNPSIFHYTTFETADQLFSQHPIWQQARIESERRELFHEYLTELQNREQVGLFLFTRNLL